MRNLNFSLYPSNQHWRKFRWRSICASYLKRYAGNNRKELLKDQEDSMQGKLLDQARELMSKAEKTTDPSSKKALLGRALEALDELMENEPAEKEIIIIRNMKKSFARSLVSQINNMNMKDIETTKFFFFNFVQKFPVEINELMNENNDFDKNIKWLAEQFLSDIA